MTTPDITDLLRRCRAVIEGRGWTELEADIAKVLVELKAPAPELVDAQRRGLTDEEEEVAYAVFISKTKSRNGRSSVPTLWETWQARAALDKPTTESKRVTTTEVPQPATSGTAECSIKPAPDATAQPATVVELPELPEPAAFALVAGPYWIECRPLADSNDPDLAEYSRNQMHEFARAAITADRARRESAPDAAALVEAARGCIDVMLHNGVPCEPTHPANVALRKAEAAIAAYDQQTGGV